MPIFHEKKKKIYIFSSDFINFMVPSNYHLTLHSIYDIQNIMAERRFRFEMKISLYLIRK